MGKFFGRVGVGMLVSFPVICLLTGGVNEGFELLLVSIVCTAGIGLVVWIPVWAIAGWVTLGVLGRLFNVNKVAEQPKLKPTREFDDQSDQNPTVGARRGKRPFAEVRALKAYVMRAMEEGMDVEEMTRRLRQNGWEPEEIQGAHQRFLITQSETHES